MNTRISYLYRDACNYKEVHEVIVSGSVDEARIRSSLRDREFFVPSEVGLLDLQPQPLTVDDHIWHEITLIEATEDAPTVSTTASQLTASFDVAFENDWRERVVFERKGIL